jgi:hypothetical protein
MFILIPTGLIASLVRHAAGGPDWYANGQRAPDPDQIAAQRAAAMVDMRAQEILWACTGHDACLVFLGDNDWTNCRFDGVRLAPGPSAAAQPAANAGYRQGAHDLGLGPHAVAGVCAGRHVVVSQVGGKQAVLHLTLHPREACFVRLDADARFVHYEPAQEQAIFARVNELSFLSYAEQVALPRIRAMVARSGQEATSDCLREVHGILAGVIAKDATAVRDRMEKAVGAILGAPVPSFERITTFVGFHAFDLLGKNKVDEASALVAAGLSILPDDPTLLGILGELKLHAGDREGSGEALRKALAREGAMDPKLRERVRALLAAS